MLESEILNWLTDNLIRLGPIVLFVACLLETALFAGLILPVGALIAVSAMLSSRGVFDPMDVILVALGGAFLGDQLGFLVGRWFHVGARPRRGRVARVWGGALAKTESLVKSKGLLGISVARATPFVRTIMPWFAGRAGIPWNRFVLFDTMGILLWATIYLGGGFVAGRGWSEVVGQFGEVAGGVVLTVALIGVIVFGRGRIERLVRKRGRSGRPSASEDPTQSTGGMPAVDAASPVEP